MTTLDRIRGWADTLRAESLALWFAMRDPRTPMAAKAFAALVLAYALSPIDLIPDFIPILGYLDELLLLPLAIRLLIRLVPAQIMSQSRAKAAAWLAAGEKTPSSRLGVVIVISIWVSVACWLILILAPALASGYDSGRG